MSKDEQHKLGLVSATAMSVTIVVGAGLLALPGLSYAHAGRLGYLPWLLMTFVMLPLLAIFSFFAQRNPSAGGVVGYIGISLGPRWAAISQVIILGTFSLGIPAIVLIGAIHLHQILPGLPTMAAALGILTTSLLLSLSGMKVSGAVQTGIALLIILGLTGLSTGYWLQAPQADASAASAALPTSAWAAGAGVLSAVPIILYAYTGWEMTAFLAEDMQDPHRNLPRSIWGSFIVVSLLYVFVAWTVASAATPSDAWRLTPIAQLARSWLGQPGLLITSLIATLLIFANVTAAFLSASRAVFSAGREGRLPQALARTDHRGLPVHAMLATWAVFVTVVVLSQAGGLGVDALMQLTGQNFFVIYLLATIGYTRLQTRPGPRLLGMASTLLVLAMMSLFSLPGLLYCGTLALLGHLTFRPATAPPAACGEAPPRSS